MDSIQVQEIMAHDLIIISPEKMVNSAAKLMKEMNCGSLPVGNGPKHIVGMITDRDITLRVTAEGKDASNMPIADAMTQKVYSCDVATDIEDAAEQMREYDVRRLIVTREGRATGIVTLAQLLCNQDKLRISDKVLHDLLRGKKKSPVKHVRTIKPEEGY